MQLHGEQIIGGTTSRAGAGPDFHGVDPASGEQLEPGYRDATPEEVDRALQLADRAHRRIKGIDRQRRATLLEAIADAIEGLGDELLARAAAETALPEPRLRGERGRTTAQLRMFAEVVRDGWWLDARIDTAQPDRKPIPKPDTRHLQIALGPVVIFGASNFPLAFSVAGGDTASALAAGCPVVVKAHPNHPGTSEMVGRAIADAVREAGFPEGTLSLLHGAGHDTGLAMVEHPLTRAVGFTGSLAGGKAIFDAAARRDVPVPVYAEMGSVNPVFVLPGAARERGEEIARGLQSSVVLGAGQFCTNPGLVIVEEGEEQEQLRRQLAELIGDAPDATLLHAGIRRGFEEGLGRIESIAGVQRGGRQLADAGPGLAAATPTLFWTDAATFLAHEALAHEVFGPSSIMVSCDSLERMTEVAEALEGQLTATLHGTDEDLERAADLVAVLEEKAGRLVVNGYPTGVEVCDSMHHGGPYPATTDARSTSVGSLAIRRFVRPVCYQDFPQHLLPPALRDDNPEGLLRLVDGEWTRD